MLISFFISQQNIKVQLPKTITSETSREENLAVTVTSENVLYLDGKVTTMKELRLALSTPSDKKKSIIIKSDRRASLGRVIDIWDLCRELGIEKVSIATDQEK